MQIDRDTKTVMVHPVRDMFVVWLDPQAPDKALAEPVDLLIVEQIGKDDGHTFLHAQYAVVDPSDGTVMPVQDIEEYAGTYRAVSEAEALGLAAEGIASVRKRLAFIAQREAAKAAQP